MSFSHAQGPCLRTFRRRFSAVVFGLLFLVCGCGENTNPPADIARGGGTLYVGVETPFYGLDILGAGGGGILVPDMAIVCTLVAEPLFRLDTAEYGKPVNIACLHSNTSRGRQTGELLQQLFKKIGI